MSMAFLSVSRPTFSVSFVMSGPPCLGLGAGPSGATPVIACARTAHLNPLPWTCGLSLSKDAHRCSHSPASLRSEWHTYVHTLAVGGGRSLCALLTLAREAVSGLTPGLSRGSPVVCGAWTART